MESQDLITYGTTIGLLLSVGWQIFDKKFRNRHQEYDDVSDKLIARFEQTEKKLLNEIENLTKKYDELKTRFNALEGDYRHLLEIFQGRDEDTVQFRIKGLEAFDKITSIYEKVSK